MARRLVLTPVFRSCLLKVYAIVDNSVLSVQRRWMDGLGKDPEKMSQSSVLMRLDCSARLVTAALSSRVFPNQDTRDMLDAMDEMTGWQRGLWIGATLGVLLACALVAAQIGVWGLAGYFALIVVLIR
jgi:hypothetical protein